VILSTICIIIGAYILIGIILGILLGISEVISENMPFDLIPSLMLGMFWPVVLWSFLEDIWNLGTEIVEFRDKQIKNHKKNRSA
jgi:hypothetical protein